MALSYMELAISVSSLLAWSRLRAGSSAARRWMPGKRTHKSPKRSSLEKLWCTDHGYLTCAHVNSAGLLALPPPPCSLQVDPALQFFKTTWRYSSFISDGVMDGLPALLAFVRREAKLKLQREQKEAERRRESEEAQAERHFYLEDRCACA